MQVRRVLLTAISTVAISVLAIPSIAVAGEPAVIDSEIAVAAAAEVSPDIGDTLSYRPSLDSFTADTPTLVSVPTDPFDDIIIQNEAMSEAGLKLGVGLPITESTKPGLITSAGSVAYTSDDESSVDIIVEQTVDKLRVQTVIPSADAPQEFPYSITGNAVPRLTGDGGADLIVVQGNVEITVGVVQAPWAFDANGASVTTWYEVRGQELVQVVNHSTQDDVVYPVVADPTFNQINLFQWRFRWNGAETATIASGGWGATALTAICAAAGASLGPAGAAAAGAICFVYAGALVYNAGVAVNSRPKRCVQLTWTSTPGIWNPGITWVDTYAC